MSVITVEELFFWQRTAFISVPSESDDSLITLSSSQTLRFGQALTGSLQYDGALGLEFSECPADPLDTPVTADPPFPPVWPFYYDLSLIYGRDNVNQVHTFTRGDDYEFTAIVARNGTRVDLTGATMTLTAKWNLADVAAVLTCSIGDGITVTGASAGEYTVIIAGSKTSSLPTALVRLPYDIQLVEASGKKSTIMNGVLKIRPDATTT